MTTETLSAQFFYEESCRNSTGIFTPRGHAYYTSGINDPVGDGWLRLTNMTTGQNGYVIVSGNYPSSSGLTVEFDFKVWADKSGGYADGFSVFLFDGSITDGNFQPGSSGGSLGYLPSPGLTGGYLGVGIDEYGNFVNFTPGSPINTVTPNTIGVAGPASTGYSYVGHSSFTAATGGYSINHDQIVPSRPDDSRYYRRVRIQLNPQGAGMDVTVFVKINKSGDFIRLIGPVTVPTPAPSSLRVGFAGSTGASYAYHEVRDVFIKTSDDLSVYKDIPECTRNRQFPITTRIASGVYSSISDVVVNDTLPAGFVVSDSIVSGGTFSSPPVKTILGDGRQVYTYTVVLPPVGTMKIDWNGNFPVFPSDGMVRTSVGIGLPPNFVDNDTTDNYSYKEKRFNGLLNLSPLTTCAMKNQRTDLQVKVSDSTRMSYQWQMKDSNGYWTGLSGGYAESYSDDLNFTGADNYYYRYLASWNNGCLDTLNFTVTKGDGYSPNNMILTNDTTICYAAPIALTGSLPVSSTTFTYSWAKSTDGVSYTSSGDTTQHLNIAELKESTYFYRYAAGDCLQSYSDTVLISVLGKVGGGNIAANQFICYNTAPLPLTGTTGVGGTLTYTYQWQSSSNKTTWADITGEIGQNYAPGVLTDTMHYRRQVTNVCATAFSDTVTINVAQQLTPGQISASCDNSPVKLSATEASGGKAITYQWQSSTNNVLWVDEPAATLRDYIPAGLSVSSYFRLLYLDVACNDTVMSNTILVKVNEPISPGVLSANQAICKNATPAQITGTAANYGNYQWQISTDNTNWSSISATDALNYSPGALSQTTYFRRLAYYLCDTVVSNVITIAVQSEPLLNFTADAGKTCFENIPVIELSQLTTHYHYTIYSDSLLTNKQGEVTGKVSEILTLTTPVTENTTYYVVVSDSLGCYSLQSHMDVEVIKLHILPEKLPPYNNRESYSFQLQSNAVSPSYSITQGNMPMGLFLGSSGLISGRTPLHEHSAPTFTVRVEDENGCETTREYTLEGDLFVPKVFTPNGDGINDVFMPGYKLVIFDRNGIQLYEGENGWDGMYKNKVVPSDIYFYKLYYENKDGETKTKTGYIGVQI